MPNWFVHLRWALKAGISKDIANFVNRSIDYGSDWCQNDQLKDDQLDEACDSEGVMYQQLQHFYERDTKKLSFVKAAYIHYLLDYFRETRHDIYDFNLIFEKFMQEKAIESILDSKGKSVNFQNVLEEIFTFFRKNKSDLLSDLLGIIV